MAETTASIHDNEAARRYEMDVEGQVAFAEYMLSPGKITFVHTVVPEALEGRGIGSALARHVLDDARRRGLTVVPRCPFIRAYIERHPEYESLLKGAGA